MDNWIASTWLGNLLVKADMRKFMNFIEFNVIFYGIKITNHIYFGIIVDDTPRKDGSNDSQ